MQNKKITTRLICRFFRNLFGLANPQMVRFYLDGFNFYYGVARKYGIKWIDMEELLISIVREKIPNAEVEKIFIFAAPAKTDAAHLRQQTYFSALKARKNSHITIIEGKFDPVTKKGKNIEVTIETETLGGEKTQQQFKEEGDVKKLEVSFWEEKRTDVNLGCKIVEDAYIKTNLFDISCLVSNDGDFSYPLKAKERLEQRILLITPRTEDTLKGPSANLIKHIPNEEDKILQISKKLVKSCQLPDKVGKYHIPAKWKQPKPESVA